MAQPSTPLIQLELTNTLITNPIIDHVLRLSLQMHKLGWIGSDQLTFKMENADTFRIEYSLHEGRFNRRVAIIAKNEMVTTVNKSVTAFKHLNP